MRLRKGFTIVELVLVIAALGILATAAIVFSPSPGTTRLDAAVRQVMSDIAYAQQCATMSNVTCGATFVAGGSYTVYRGTTATPLTNPLTKQPMVITLTLQYSGIYLSNGFTVEFNRFGMPTTGGGGTVKVTDGTNSRAISVEVNTGRVSVIP